MNIVKSLLIGLAIIITAGCEKSEIITYSPDKPAVNFPDGYILNVYDIPENSSYSVENNLFVYSFSFISAPGQTSYELEIPVMLVGLPVDRDRKVTYRIIPADEEVEGSNIDNPTSAVEDVDYVIGEAVIPADSVFGYIKITVNNKPSLADESLYLNIEITSSDDLMKGAKEQAIASIVWNDAVIRPTHSHQYYSYNMLIHNANRALSSSKTAYSSNGQKLIQIILESEVLPRFNHLPWMLYPSNYKSYAAKMAQYLEEWDKNNPDSPWIHNEGDLMGKKIYARDFAPEDYLD